MTPRNPLDVVMPDIQHLDFPVEEPAKEPKTTHFADPVNKAICWCGKPCKDPEEPYGVRNSIPVTTITCAGCLQKFIDPGPQWWWDVHRAYFRSECNPGAHNCGA